MVEAGDWGGRSPSVHWDRVKLESKYPEEGGGPGRWFRQEKGVVGDRDSTGFG